jgi:hypothetical protein
MILVMCASCCQPRRGREALHFMDKSNSLSNNRPKQSKLFFAWKFNGRET